MEHLNGCGLVTNTLRQEAPKLLPALILCGGALCGFKTLSASLGSDGCGEIGELLGQQGR